jgi:hypothetical protein
MLGNSRVSERLAASQERLDSMDPNIRMMKSALSHI